MSTLVSVCNTGSIHKSVVQCLLKLIKNSSVTIIMPTHSPYENNLHHVISDFLKSDHEFWLNIDADNPPTKNPLELIDRNLDIVGLPTPVWHYIGKEGERPVYWNVYEKKNEDHLVVTTCNRCGNHPTIEEYDSQKGFCSDCYALPRKDTQLWEKYFKPFFRSPGYTEWFPRVGLQEVDAVGTGCFLAHRRVFEHTDMKAPFHRIYNEDGTVERGNDIAFCEKAKAAGFKVWAHFDYSCDHYNELPLNEVIRAFKGLGVK